MTRFSPMLLLVAAVGLAQVGGAAAKAPEDAAPRAVEITAKAPEFGDLTQVLRIRKIAGTYRFSQEADLVVRLQFRFYQNGQLVKSLSKGGTLGVSPEKAADSGQFDVHLVDLDYLHLGDAKAGHYSLHYQLEMDGVSARGDLEIPKSNFDIGKNYGWTPFTEKHGKPGEAPLFAMIGKNADVVLGGVSPEKLLKANPRADILIAVLEFE